MKERIATFFFCVLTLVACQEHILRTESINVGIQVLDAQELPVKHYDIAILPGRDSNTPYWEKTERTRFTVKVTIYEDPARFFPVISEDGVCGFDGIDKADIYTVLIRIEDKEYSIVVDSSDFFDGVVIAFRIEENDTISKSTVKLSREKYIQHFATLSLPSL